MGETSSSKLQVAAVVMLVLGTIGIFALMFR
jgi:hypothetical protein